MIGMMVWTTPEKHKKAVVVRECSVFHMRFLCAEIVRSTKTPAAVVSRRVASAAKKLRKTGVEQVILPENFCFGEQIYKWKLRPVSTLPLRQALAADWVRWALAERGLTGTRIAVSASGLTGEVVHTVTALALRYRYVLLDVPRDGEMLCRQLRREYGVSLLLAPTAEQLREAEVLVLFDRCERESCGCVLRLYDESVPLPPLVLPPAMEETLPEGVERGQLLSALRSAGALRPEQIAVGGGNTAK